MGVAWQYFRQYEIVKHEENDFDYMIRYLDGDKLLLTYLTSGNLTGVFSSFNIDIPMYCEFDPPNSGVLELVSPIKIIKVCEKVIKVLKEETNPEFTDSSNEEKWRLWGPDDLNNYKCDTIEDLNNRFIRQLICIQELSRQGFYFVKDID
ncbi:vacuolar protein-sorting protein 36 [Bacillus mycoides]|uniref:vacuolar protein-sorting protein 36 n=1 Tax=Bacillus mycoides TaxID=1405 RepID=UPI003D660DE9